MNPGQVTRLTTGTLVLLAWTLAFDFGCVRREVEPGKSTASASGVENGGVLILPARLGLAKNNGASPWYAEFGIGSGSEPQLFKLLIDSGTATTWVVSKECATSPCKHHRRFDHRSSESHVRLDPMEHVAELGPWGTFHYVLGQDTWSFWAGALGPEASDLRRLRVNQMRFLEAVRLIDGAGPDGTSNTNWDDLVQDGSLAIPADPAGSPSTELLDCLISQGLVRRKIVSYWTSRERNRGALILGGLDRTRFAPDTLAYFPVSQDITAGPDHAADLWSVKLDSVRVGSEEVELPRDGAAFVLDTGSSRFKGDPDIIGRIVALITADGSRSTTVEDPDILSDYPDLVIVLVDEAGQRRDYRLTPGDYFQEFPDRWELALNPLYPTATSSTRQLLLAGSVFMDHHYTVFDYTTDPVRVGLAERVVP